MTHGPAHQQLAGRLAVPRQLLAVGADDLHVDAEHRAALLGLDREALLRVRQSRVPGLTACRRAERAHLGHAPGVQHLHVDSAPGSVRIIAGGQAEPPITVRRIVRERAGHSRRHVRAGPARPSARRPRSVTRSLSNSS